MIGVKLQRLKMEDLIWVIYLFIAIAAIISNVYERNFLLTKNYTSQKKYKFINISIFCIALFIYVYFVFVNYEYVTALKKDITKKEGLNKQLGLISALLFLVGGVIALYVEINSDSPDEDIGLV